MCIKNPVLGRSIVCTKQNVRKKFSPHCNQQRSETSAVVHQIISFSVPRLQNGLGRTIVENQAGDSLKQILGVAFLIFSLSTGARFNRVKYANALFLHFVRKALEKLSVSLEKKLFKLKFFTGTPFSLQPPLFFAFALSDRPNDSREKLDKRPRRPFLKQSRRTCPHISNDNKVAGNAASRTQTQKVEITAR